MRNRAVIAPARHVVGKDLGIHQIGMEFLIRDFFVHQLLGSGLVSHQIGWLHQFSRPLGDRLLSAKHFLLQRFRETVRRLTETALEETDNRIGE